MCTPSSKPSEYRNPKEYRDYLRRVFLAYVSTEEFGTLTTEQRKQEADMHREIIMLLDEQEQNNNTGDKEKPEARILELNNNNAEHEKTAGQV